MQQSDHSHEAKEFSHEELRAGLIYYVSRKFNLDKGDQLQDSLHFMLRVPDTDVQPAEGTLYLTLVESDIVEDDTKSPRHLRPDFPPPFIRGTSGTDVPVYKSSGLLLGIPEDYLLMMMAATVAVITILTVFTVARCASRRRPQDKRSDIGLDMDGTTVAPDIPMESRSKVITKDNALELECRASDITSTPSSRPGQQHLSHHHHLHQNGGTGGLGIAAHLTDSGVTWPQDICPEVSTVVPQCKVQSFSFSQILQFNTKNICFHIFNQSVP